jgi:predicted RNase H-like HicB family nuclease
MTGELRNVLNQECVHLRVWHEDGMYIAACLDIPGCISQGLTREEALTNVHEAISMCLDVIEQDAEAGAGRGIAIMKAVPASGRDAARRRSLKSLMPLGKTKATATTVANRYFAVPGAHDASPALRTRSVSPRGA